jgi:hypothetical protein
MFILFFLGRFKVERKFSNLWRAAHFTNERFLSRSEMLGLKIRFEKVCFIFVRDRERVPHEM